MNLTQSSRNFQRETCQVQIAAQKNICRQLMAIIQKGDGLGIRAPHVQKKLIRRYWRLTEIERIPDIRDRYFAFVRFAQERARGEI